MLSGNSKKSCCRHCNLQRFCTATRHDPPSLGQNCLQQARHILSEPLLLTDKLHFCRAFWLKGQACVVCRLIRQCGLQVSYKDSSPEDGISLWPHACAHCHSCLCSCLPVLRGKFYLLQDQCHRPGSARSLLGAGQEPGSVVPLYGWRRRSAWWRCCVCCGVAERSVQLKKAIRAEAFRFLPSGSRPMSDSQRLQRLKGAISSLWSKGGVLSTLLYTASHRIATSITTPKAMMAENVE